MNTVTILWRLRNDHGATAHAEARPVDRGVELRYVVGGTPMLFRRFDDGAELMREAADLRFELERRGWYSELVERPGLMVQ